MKSGIITNFRGLRALVLQGPDVNLETLVSVLGRLGLGVTVLAPDAPAAGGLPECDVLFFDADEDLAGPRMAGEEPDVPTIALIGHEAPSRLVRVVSPRCDSHILKPIRNTGVFTALLLAVNGHRDRRRIEQELDVLRQRLTGRREVMKAVLGQMALSGIDEDSAYQRLRQEAMNRRVPIEDVARDWLATPPAAGQPTEPNRKSGQV